MSKKRRIEPSARTRKHSQSQTHQSEVIRRRKIMLAAGIAVIAAAVVVIVCVALGVFDKRAEVSTVTLEEDGTIIGEEIETFKEGYYSKSELQTFVKDAINQYNDKAGEKAVKLKKLSVKGDEAYLKIIYKSAGDYQAFNGYEMFVGSVGTAGDAGYDLADVFAAVTDGAKGDPANAQDVMKDADANVIALRQNVTVRTPGRLLYVSDQDTKVTSDDTVTISPADGNPDATGLTYIIYK